MKILLSFFLIAISSGLFAQDTIRSLVITEIRMDWHPNFYIEFTNMGEKPIELSQFEIGKLISGFRPPFKAGPQEFARLPEKMLHPEETYLMCTANDYYREEFTKGSIEFYEERSNKPELLELADYVVHVEETGMESDSVDSRYNIIFRINASNCFYLEQHFQNGDSLVIDQVNGIFDGPWGTQRLQNGNDVAGYPFATVNSTIIRKHNIINGNPDFFNARGIGEDDSEWIVVPNQGGPYQKLFWTAGNHVNAVLNENTLEPVAENVSVDFSNKTITVPWGTRRADDVMSTFKKKEGIAWNYHLNSNPEDSLTHAVRTGDQLEVFVCGNEVQKAVFTIVVSEPPIDANILIPLEKPYLEADWLYHMCYIQDGFLDWPRITRHNSGMDTIWGYGGGIPFATRTDSLLQRLEKAPDASLEFIWVDGVARPDLKDGDILKVTAENGETKKYYISVLYELKNHNAYLSSITWPDIPELNKGIFGWTGDTIPNFGPTVYNYILTVPFNADGIPTLVAKTNNQNAQVHVKRAKNLTGTREDRTITFTVTAEDDSTYRVYSIELVKEQDPLDVQPWFADPFLSEFIFFDQWNNGFIEIYNPGNQPLDLSNYMMLCNWSNNPAEAITWHSEPSGWMNRYCKYVPGYKWVNEAQWAVTPGILEQNLAVNPIVMPGDVFCIGNIYYCFENPDDYLWPVPAQLDVQFNNDFIGFGLEGNPWNEAVGGNLANQWNGANFYMYKILNDSVKLGLKPANDPNDFKLIETFGDGDGSSWSPGGMEWGNPINYIRKPEYWQGKTGFRESFGDTPEESEWTWTNGPYWQNLNVYWPYNIFYIGNDLGKHYAYTVTHFMSTISSVVYKVSPGYGKNGTIENIRGMTSGVTVGEFMGNLVKKNEGQDLKVKGTIGELAMNALVNSNDTLVVLSADSTNTTKYILEVTEAGLSSLASLTSNKYGIFLNSEPGTVNEPGQATITGFDYGTSLKTILANVHIPAGALLSAIDENGAYVPLKQLNYNNQYVPVTVNSGIYLEVIAEDGVTTIQYQLFPETTEDDAFILSDVYSVSQKNLLIEFVPRGTNVISLLANLVPSEGATVKVVNKMGQERENGEIYQDDKVVVTSANGMYMKVYFISMLAEKYIPETTYLAYILSDVYGIDQLSDSITGVASGTSVSEFLTKVTPAMGATVVVVDKDGNQKATGNITTTDRIKVTSLDGKTSVTYFFDTVVSTRIFNNDFIKIYPNPTDGKIYIDGIISGTRITVYDAMGSKVLDIISKERIETVSLGNQQTGIYLFRISDGKKVQKSYKIIKR